MLDCTPVYFNIEFTCTQPFLVLHQARQLESFLKVVSGTYKGSLHKFCAASNRLGPIQNLALKQIQFSVKKNWPSIAEVLMVLTNLWKKYFEIWVIFLFDTSKARKIIMFTVTRPKTRVRRSQIFSIFSRYLSYDKGMIRPQMFRTLEVVVGNFRIGAKNGSIQVTENRTIFYRYNHYSTLG